MASWIVHLRVAEKVAKKISGFEDELFWIGNIAPDSGTWDARVKNYVPSPKISHWCETDSKKTIQPDRFYIENLEGKHQQKDALFYWGYYCHLITDVMWGDEIHYPIVDEFEKNPEMVSENMKQYRKEQAYIDAVFLDHNEKFEALASLRKAAPIKNKWFDYFETEAMEQKRSEIILYCDYLKNESMETVFLNCDLVNDFVCRTAAKIVEKFRKLGVNQ